MAVDLPRVNCTPCLVRRVHWSQPEAPCDRCRRAAPRVWKVDRTALDLDLERPVLLSVTVSVHHCAGCGHFFRVQPPFLRPDATYTNRVVAASVASVFDDGMAVTRVAARLARDFWVRPSEAMIRRWCRAYADGLDFVGSYQPWVVEEFSGVLCVDEVYQDRLALLLAVDPAGDDGDRLVGYQLVHGAVEQRDVARFLQRLQTAGIEPEQVVTDGSALYPAVVAAVWPTAAHQLCLFHETRPVTKAALQVVKDVTAALPTPPKIQRPRGRPPKATAAPASSEGPSAPADRPACVARVQRLKRDGCSIRAIVRQTGHSRNTIRRWLREEDVVLDDATGVPAAPSGRPPPSAAGPPPEPWPSWEELRRFRQSLNDHRFLLVRRPDHLAAAEQAALADLLAAPGAAALGVARAFVEDWYAIWRDEAGARRRPEEAWQRFGAWQATPAYRALAPLADALERLTDERFARLSQFLARPAWEATNNGAERVGRLFRHRQAPHFRLRTAAAIEDDLRVWAVHRRAAASAHPSASPAVRPRRDQAARPSQDRPMAA